MRHVLPLTLLYLLSLVSPASAGDKKPIQLFNGKDLSGWTYFLVDPNAKMSDVWSVKDGMLICKGEPMGYLATKGKYKNFKLIVEWRWAPGKKPGNSGVLLRITGKPAMLPRCVEAQLHSGDAGDIWAFNGFHISSQSDRFVEKDNPKIGHFMGVKKIRANEHTPPEWNRYEIRIKGDKLVLKVNGEVVNQCSGCDEVAGQIGLQSEGGEIHFRKVELTPLGD